MTATPDKNKIARLAEHFKNFYPSDVRAGIDALNCLPSKQQQAVVDFLIDHVMTEVKAGLGLLGLSDNEAVDDGELAIFNKIADIYEEAAGGCYFCSEAVDPEEDEFGPEVKLCLICTLKLANFTEALGIPAHKVFKNVPPRDHQISRVEIEE